MLGVSASRSRSISWVHAFLRDPSERLGLRAREETGGKRMRAKLREIKEQLMAIRHEGTERHDDTDHLAFCWTENISAPNLSYAAQYLVCGLTTTRA